MMIIGTAGRCERTGWEVNSLPKYTALSMLDGMAAFLRGSHIHMLPVSELRVLNQGIIENPSGVSRGDIQEQRGPFEACG